MLNYWNKSLHVVRVSLCGMQCFNLNEQTVKILGIHFSYNKKLEEKKNYIAKIENVFKVWRMRDLTMEGKFVIFESLAIISNVVHLALIKAVPICDAEQLNIIEKTLFGKEKKTKIKHSTLRRRYVL